MGATYWLSVAAAPLTCFWVCSTIFFSLVYRFTAIPTGHTQLFWDLRYYQEIPKEIVPMIWSATVFLLGTATALEVKPTGNFSFLRYISLLCTVQPGKHFPNGGMKGEVS